MLRIAGAALNQTPIDWNRNFENCTYAIEYARLHDVKILCLPELCISGYGCEDLFLSDWIYQTAWNQLIRLKPYTYDIAVAVGFPMLFKGVRYNAVALLENTKIIGIYCKQFLANDGIHYECRWFQPWPRGYVDVVSDKHGEIPVGDMIWSIYNVNIGFEICEDAWRAKERPAIAHCARGVDLILNPSASHFALEKTDIRKDLVTGSSKEFACTYVYANLLGNEGGKVIYDGDILIAKDGYILARSSICSFQRFQVVWADIPSQKSDHSYTIAKHVEDLTPNEAFRRAVTLGLWDYMIKSKSNGFVLSLSGGADSSCIAVLVAEMWKQAVKELGHDVALNYADITGLISENKTPMQILLTCAYQSTQNSSKETLHAAQSLAASLGATFYYWQIDASVDLAIQTISRQINKTLTWDTDDLVLQNIQARSRSPLIWMLANINHSLLLTTSNRSEGDVGYCTMDGDTSGSIAPIAGVSKHFVKNWLLWAEKELGYSALQHVNQLAPSAELRPQSAKQTDEADLMPYDILLQIEEKAIRDRLSPVDVYLTLRSEIKTTELKNYVRKFFTLWARNQWKRERLAPSFHLDDFNVDPRSWCRFPILNGGFEEELNQLNKIPT